MDRQTIYSGQLPRTLDLLMAQQFAMIGLAKLSETTLGTPGTCVSGFTCTPTTPASLNIVLTPGVIYQVEDLEATTWSAVSANISNTILKQGILLNSVTLGITPPNQVGFSQVFLLEVQYQDFDTGALVLPYFNAASPSNPFSGPGNAGTAQNTVRQGLAAYQIKAGTAAATGTQVAPTPDAGWTGLFLITVANGAVTITSGNIVSMVGPSPALPTVQAPFVPVTLNQVPVAVQSGMWQYGTDTSPGGAVTTTASTTTSSAILTFASVPSFVATGMKAFDASTPGAITGGQTVLSKTSTTVTLSANVNATVNNGDSICFSGNAMVAKNFNPPIAALVPGMGIRVKSVAANTGALTLDVGTGANAVTRANLSACSALDIAANMIVDLVWDGTEWQIQNFEGFNASTTSTTNNFFQGTTIPYCVDTGTVNNIVAPFSPPITAPTAGNTLVVVKLANTVTGATQITVNSLSAVPVINQFAQPMTSGSIVAGEFLFMIYTGSSWQLIGSTSGTGPTIQSMTSSGTYTPTTGKTTGIAFLTGAGGGGGGAVGGGGGGGETVIKLLALSTLSGGATVTIGAGGPGVNTGVQGNNGGDSSLVHSSTTLMLAKGGIGGNMNAGNEIAIGGAGGDNNRSAGIGDILLPGAFGQIGMNSGPQSGGAGGPSFWGGGGYQDSPSSSPGPAFIGAGGGGGYFAGVTSGNGGNGFFFVMEF